MRRIVILSGPVASGKSALGDGLRDNYGFEKVKTRDLIAKLKPHAKLTRLSLQRAGDALDRSTGGRWVVDELARQLLSLDENVDVVVDSVRKQEQIDALREVYGRAIFHVHVTAPMDELRKRYANRDAHVAELRSYDEVRKNATERRIEQLAIIADVVVDSARSAKGDVLTRVASGLGLYGVSRERLVDVLVGGQWGSEGKGHIAWYLAPEYDLLVRTGGPNAGHTVVERERGKYTFHLLPSGTMESSSARLLIGPGATIRVDKLLEEIAECDVSYERLSIDPQVMVITDDDMAAETGLVAGIGSTGQGGGSAAARRIMGRRGDAQVKLAKDYPELTPYIREAAGILETAYAQGQRVLLEGTQGTGLSLYHGSYPHVTSRDTTASGTCAEAGVPPHRVNHVIMVCRTFPIRVQNPENGTSGPMGIETSWATVAARAGLDVADVQAAEKTSTTKKDRRVAEFGWADLRRASTLNGPTDVALTFADYLSVKNRDARRFEQLEEATIMFIEEVGRVAAAPVSLITTRFHERSIIDRRSWGKR